MYEEIMIADCGRQEATISSLLQEGLVEWKRSAPGHRPRLSAREQGASEAELAACELGSSVTRLDPHFRGIIYELPAVGEVLAVTKNEHCIHEKQGVFNHVSIGPDQGFVLNRDVDLRLFVSHWRHVFVVREEAASGPRTSLQFFDSGGAAVHIVYLTERSNRGAFDAIVARFRSTDQSPGIEITSSPPAPQDRPDREDQPCRVPRMLGRRTSPPGLFFQSFSGVWHKPPASLSPFRPRICLSRRAPFAPACSRSSVANANADGVHGRQPGLHPTSYWPRKYSRRGWTLAPCAGAKVQSATAGG